jgi:ABC-type multidrug transport system permease subunit
MPLPAQVRSVVTGSHLDRAMGFRHAMLPVAGVAGTLGAIAAISLFGVPLLSFALLLWFFTVFCVTWLIGYALHTFVSADGAALVQVIGMYRILSREQKARLRRMDGDR